MQSQITDAEQKIREDIAQEFLEWIFLARGLVGSHFPNDMTSAPSPLVVETAKSMMIMHKMGEMEKSVDRMCRALESI